MDVGIALLGAGAWGRNYIRVFSELSGSRVLACADPSPSALAPLAERFPAARLLQSAEEAFALPGVQAAVIATPAATHYDLVQAALAAGKHVLVEKPLVVASSQGRDLVDRAEAAGRVLMVGHTFLYNNSVRKVKEIVGARDFGRLYYLTCRRNNLGPIREDVSVVWDLAAHDVSILNYLLDAPPSEVAAVGGSFLKPERPDAAFLTLRYPGGVLAHIQASWVDSHKIRELVAIGDRRRVVFDDLNPMEPVRIFEKGASVERAVDTFGEFQYLLRDGDILSPHVDRAEPLKNQCQEFLRCVRDGARPLSDGRRGLDVVRVLEAAARSLERGGVPVAVEAS